MKEDRDMILCDRCVKEAAKHVLKLTGPNAVELIYHSWALCGDCLNHVCGTAQKAVEDFNPDDLKEFCPSLTPDQRVKVLQWFVGATRKGKTR